MTTFMGSETSIRFDADVAVPMRDGTRLYADVYRPQARGRCPVLLQRTPYNKSMPRQRAMPLDAVRALETPELTILCFEDTAGASGTQGIRRRAQGAGCKPGHLSWARRLSSV